MEILFVLGFFVMLMLTGISLVGVIVALIMATALMVVGGLFAMVIKLLPWLLLAVAVAWLYRAVKKPKVLVRRRYMRF
ncbi:envelope stress response protein PspG [Duffyella gerundensis]|uniref:envelope stress response protein PspG n=1 Tax=Duffyella TaxID=3026546 RepID=UPI003F6DBCED